MAPRPEDASSKTEELGDDLDSEENLDKLIAPQASPRKHELVYITIVVFSLGHLAALYGLYLCFTSAMWKTLILNWVLTVLAIIGQTAGAHRLWTHRAYKVKLPLEILLMIMSSIAFHYTATNWVREHRMHHRYSDTDADPHNATRGFFFSHIGWLFVRKHPELRKRGKFIDMSDVYANPVLRFQKKYAVPFMGSACFLLPTIIPIYFWGETLNNAWHVVALRYIYTVHIVGLVNSVGHLYGTRPYDKSINPVQNTLNSYITMGEGNHNYHHVYPWDYRTAELGDNWLNPTTMFIDFFAWIGWVYDMKTASPEVVEARAKRTGDGTYVKLNEY